jgi:hypothetical protein
MPKSNSEFETEGLSEMYSPIVILLDASGSMHVRQDATLAALNQLISETAGARETPLFVYAFNTEWWAMRKTTLGEFVPIREGEYDPDGETALYDVVGALMTKHQLPCTTFVIISDGRDTASTTETDESITRDVNFARDHEHCRFLFIGYGEDAKETGASLGVSAQDMFLTTGDLGSMISSSQVVLAVSQSLGYSSANLSPQVAPTRVTSPEPAPSSQAFDLDEEPVAERVLKKGKK